MILDENPNFPPKFVKILINKKKKKKVQFFFFFFKFYLTCFTTVPIFKSIGPLVAEIWGGAKTAPPPPPQISATNDWLENWHSCKTSQVE